VDTADVLGEHLDLLFVLGRLVAKVVDQVGESVSTHDHRRELQGYREGLEVAELGIRLEHRDEVSKRSLHGTDAAADAGAPRLHVQLDVANGGQLVAVESAEEVVGEVEGFAEGRDAEDVVQAEVWECFVVDLATDAEE